MHKAVNKSINIINQETKAFVLQKYRASNTPCAWIKTAEKHAAD